MKSLIIWLKSYWIICSAIITLSPIIVKVIIDFYEMDKMLIANYEMSKKLEPMIIKVDTIFVHQKSIIIDVKSIKESNKIRDKKDSVMLFVMKQTAINEAKNKSDILKSIKEFGPYWNFNEKKKLDTIRFPFCYQNQERF